MNRKRIFALAFAVLMVLSLAACGTKGGDKMDGMSSDQTDAATITPEAKPKNSVLSLPESSPLKMNTSAAPAVVAMKMIQKTSTVIAVVVKSALLSCRYFFPTNSLE